MSVPSGRFFILGGKCFVYVYRFYLEVWKRRVDGLYISVVVRECFHEISIEFSIVFLELAFSQRKSIWEINIEAFGERIFTREYRGCSVTKWIHVASRCFTLIRVMIFCIIGERIWYVKGIFVSIVSEGIFREIRQLWSYRWYCMCSAGWSGWCRSSQCWFRLKQVFFSGQFSFTEKVERIAQEPLVIVRLLDHTWLSLNTRIYSIASESKYSSSFVLILLQIKNSNTQ